MIDRPFAFALLAALLAAFEISGQIAPEKIAEQPGFVRSESIAQEPPTAFSHASTVVQARNGDLVCAWFGGSKERTRDVNIWSSRNAGQGWSEPVEVADGIHDEIHERNPLWNPVLYLMPNGSLVLFYKEGPSPERWWGLRKMSHDNGATWSKAIKLPGGFLGPVRNKPITLESGTILCGSSVESSGWLVHFERTLDLIEWTRGDAINSSMAYGGAIQPTLLSYPDGKLQTLCRTKYGKIFGAWSEDAGFHWSRLKEIDLPNPNGAIDAVMLKDGKALLVYNHSQTDRSVLNVALTKDGKKWEAVLLLESEPGGEFSYPAVIQTADGLVHITYSWKKLGIRHVVLDASKFAPIPMVEGAWPK